MKNGWFFYDVGGVLIQYDENYMYQMLAELFSVGLPEMTGFINENGTGKSPREQFDLGLSDEQIYELFIRRFKTEMDLKSFVRLVEERARSCIRENEADKFQSLMRKLQKLRVDIGIISNIDVIHARVSERIPFYFWENIPKEKRFFSCDVGLAKPDPDFFRYVFNRCNTEPRHCFLLDDKLENVEGFRSSGGQAELFVYPESIRELHLLPERLNRLGIV